MDDASLIASISALCKRQPPPPKHVLQEVVRILMEARGATDAGADHLGTATSIGCTSLKSSESSSRPASRSRPASSASSRSGQQHATAEQMSLRQLGQPDAKMAAYLARHEQRHAEGIRKPVDLRQRKVVQYQALCEGQGGKHVHADYVQNGSTQIAGHQSFTPSLLAGGGLKQLAMVSGALAAGKQPYNSDNKFNFRP